MYKNQWINHLWKKLMKLGNVSKHRVLLMHNYFLMKQFKNIFFFRIEIQIGKV